MKIVESGYKIDLHIHSCYSRIKDGAKVAFNTIEHIDVLVQKLHENGVQICAITDHDTFNYELYHKLKEYEQSELSIMKVLPGVEFSVEFEGDSSPAVVHVIAVFDDSDDNKIQRISSILEKSSGKPNYDRDMAFSEEAFLSILREIQIDTILIAHQKNSITSKKPQKSDAITVGQDRFKEFITTEYFEAFEFKNRRNEVFNKAFLFKSKLEDNIRFITGSDCHDWRVYPKETESDKSDFVYSYIKCLPTFRGLVMAITDHRRIKTVNSFFNVAQSYLPTIDMSIDGNDIHIPLSRGINVIIGDNSIGKSLLLHKLTGYCKQQSKDIKRSLVESYNRYLKSNGIVIHSEITSDLLFGFDMQGEVRKKFEEKLLKSDEFLKEFYPHEVNASPYREIIQRELDKVYRYLERKFEIESLISQLGKYRLVNLSEFKPESLVFTGTVRPNSKKSSDLAEISASIETIIQEIHTLLSNPLLTSQDKTDLKEIEKQIVNFSQRFKSRKANVDYENQVIAIFKTVLSAFQTDYEKVITDTQKMLSSYQAATKKAEDSIVEILTCQYQNQQPIIEFEPIEVDIQTKKIFNYCFNSRLNILQITTDYFWNLFVRAFKKDTPQSVLEMTQGELAAALLRYDGPEKDALNELKRSISTILDDDFKPKYTITESGYDKTDELSAGLNAKIYFDILSYATDKNGIYIIDQPEDNISQKSIGDYLLERFKEMAEHRQVIIVTHNPQFIVNLDVDNVVYLGKDDNGKYLIRSGALEYQDNTYSMLDIVSTHIEGGLETLQKRWKRYEKNNRISSQ